VPLRVSKKDVVQFVVSRRRRVVGVIVLALLVTGGLAWRASWIAHKLLRSWTASTIREKSGDVYQLAVGQVRLNFLLRRLTVDSLVLTTNAEPNARRPQPLTTLGLAVHGCSIVGVHLVTLATGGGLIADSLTCEQVNIRMVMPRVAIAPVELVPGMPRAFLELQQGLRLPPFAPRMRIERIDLPQASLDLRVERPFGADSQLRLQQLQWHMAGFAIDPSDSLAATRPLFSKVVEVRAADFTAHPDSAATVRIDSLVASLTDSTLEMRGIAFAPNVGAAAFQGGREYRRTLVRARIGRVSVRGIDVGTFLLGRGLRAKRVDVDSLRVGVMSDRRLLANPVPKRRKRTPQEWMADLGGAMSVDSMFLRHSHVVYRQWREGRGDPGVVTFARINATAANVRHATGKDQGPMKLTANAWLQNTGRLEASFVVPLDAPRFTMSFRGRLGPMAAESFNAFVEETFSIRVARGEIENIVFDATVVNGSARGTITPRYSGLSLAATREGRTGLLGRDGAWGGTARRLASIAGNWQKVYANNPDDARTRMRVGTIRHTFTSNETLPAFLWNGLRGGLTGVVAR
jgi:hypothetical protein